MCYMSLGGLWGGAFDKADPVGPVQLYIACIVNQACENAHTFHDDQAPVELTVEVLARSRMLQGVTGWEVKERDLDIMRIGGRWSKSDRHAVATACSNRANAKRSAHLGIAAPIPRLVGLGACQLCKPGEDLFAA